ncbi:MAG TPA: uroporphyrinogen decarboxylase family protein, partial [Gammaproteobacteria bacterium]
LGYVMDAIRLARKALDGRVPLIGFAGSPWTLATYMVEGGSGGDFRTIKGMLYAEPGLLHGLLKRLAGAVTRYLNAQIAAGAQAVMLFDSWGGVLESRAYTEFSLQYLEHIVAGLGARDTVPVIVFSKGAGHRAAEVAAIGCDCLGLDWTVDLGAVRTSTGGRVALQGNLDPAVLIAPPDVIRSEAARVLESYGRGPGHVFNLGHGITPDVDPGNVAVLVDAVHELSRPYHA